MDPSGVEGREGVPVSKKKVVPPFVQIAVTPHGGTDYVYGLDKEGKVWVRNLSNDQDGWRLLNRTDSDQII